jgi:hypothetical protein
MPWRLCRPPWCIVLFALVVRTVYGLHFYLESGEIRCLFDDAPPGSKVMGEYTVAAGTGSMPIQLDVRSGNGKVLYFQQANIEHGNFAFVVHPDESSRPSVMHAEMHRRSHGAHNADSSGRRKSAGEQAVPQGGVPEHRRRRLLAEAADQAKGAHGDSHHPESEEWDMDDYEGIDVAEMDAASRHYSVINTRDGTGARSGAGMEYDELGRNVLQEHEINTIFSVRRFSICVTSPGPREPGIRRRVRLIVRKGMAAHDYHRLARTEHMSSLEVSLHQISAELHDLLAQLELAHRMEEALRVLHYRTNRWVVRYAVVSVAIVFAVGIFQARYTRGLLKSKKIL